MATFTFEVQKERKDGTRNIKILLTHQRKLKRLSTSIYVTKADLTTRSGKIKNQEILDQIGDIIKEYRNKCNKLSLSIDTMDIDEVADYVTKKDITRIDFIKVFRDYINSHQDKKGIKNYSAALSSLVKFIRREVLGIEEITVKFLQDYEKFLGKGRAASLYLGSMRHVYNDAKLIYNDEERGVILIPYSPFSRYKVPQQNVAEKRALDVDIIRRIIELPYDETSRSKEKVNRFNLAKDCFILSFCLIGMNSADLYSCNILENRIIKYNRTKTKDRRRDKAEMHVKIAERIEVLFQKYQDATGKKVFRFHHLYADEKTFNAALNKGLKKIGKVVGVDNLEFYAARHSWATIARNDLSIDKNIINEALNHVDKNLSVTDLYIKKSFSAINEANEKVIDYIFKGVKK